MSHHFSVLTLQKTDKKQLINRIKTNIYHVKLLLCITYIVLFLARKLSRFNNQKYPLNNFSQSALFIKNKTHL